MAFLRLTRRFVRAVRASVQLPVPPDQLASTVLVLNQRRSVFDPVARIAIKHAIDFTKGGSVNMSANHSIDGLTTSFRHENLFILIEKRHGLLDSTFDRSREAPVWHP